MAKRTTYDFFSLSFSFLGDEWTSQDVQDERVRVVVGELAGVLVSGTDD